MFIHMEASDDDTMSINRNVLKPSNTIKISIISPFEVIDAQVRTFDNIALVCKSVDWRVRIN